MKKNIFLIFLCLIVFPITIKAESVEYTLFDSNLIVNKDRTIEAEENYRIYFIEDTKTINRKIDLKLVQIDPDDKKTYINSILSNVKSENAVNLDTKDNTTSVSIKVDGLQDEVSNYTLNYTYNLGKDININRDEFFYNIVSNMDASISNLTFTITFPSEIDEKNIYFSIDGDYDLTEDDVTYRVEDNKIVGSLNRLLEENQTFSVYVKLPNNYFVGATDNFNYLNFLILIFPIITFITIICYWIKYGRKNKMQVKRIKEIPYNFDPAEIGYLYKGKCEEMDLTSDLIYLANHGYLKVVENDDGYKLGKENSFKFIKLKDYEKKNAVQKILFDNLFRDGDVVELQDIEYKFAEFFKEAKSMLDTKDNDKKLFFKDINFKKLVSLILIAISVFMINFNPVHLFMNNYWLIFIIFLIYILGLYILFLSTSNTFVKLIIGGGVLAICLYVAIKPITPDNRLLIIYIIGTILILLSCNLYKKLPLRTKYGNKVLSEAYGLKYYLESISKSELEEELKTNEMFYFEMIPYAYVLDSLEAWIKKGNGTITMPPDWYIPSSEFKLSNFEKFIKNMLYTTTLVMMKQTYSEFGNVQYENTKVKTNLND
jgi:hypothetical protein